jgi:galactonate dehydratase
MDLNLPAIEQLSKTVFAEAGSFITATAISGINQALHDLVAKREKTPVWNLFSDQKLHDKVPVYTTINRALTSRTQDDYYETVSHAVEQGFSAIKCAPFEHVTPDGNQIAQAEYGLSVLQFLRKSFPELSIRIDFHERFRPAAFQEILPAVEAVSPFWIEAPVPIGPQYSELRKSCKTHMALGELYFGRPGFADITNNRWADVIMPDVKHVGGFGPLLDVCRHFSDKTESSPHNPSGPVATAASLHAAAACATVTSLELPLIKDPARAYYLEWLESGMLRVPDGPGWGIDTEQLPRA